MFDLIMCYGIVYGFGYDKIDLWCNVKVRLGSCC